MSDEAKPEAYPPRYDESGGWKRLICDEKEWLARPAPWGLGVLPDETRGHKQKLFEIHMYGWLTHWIRCERCKPLVRRAMTDDEQLSEQLVDEWRAIAHPDDGCSFWHHVHQYHSGLITWAELFGHFVHALYEAADPDARAVKSRALTLELAGPNPFRPFTFSPAWRTDTVLTLAKHMYESREFSAMPILADALQDAGCDNEQILSHCRDANQVHVRGCWVVDLVLGKE